MVKFPTRTPDISLLADPALPIPDDRRAALLKGYRALASRRSADRAQAVRALLALDQQVIELDAAFLHLGQTAVEDFNFLPALGQLFKSLGLCGIPEDFDPPKEVVAVMKNV